MSRERKNGVIARMRGAPRYLAVPAGVGLIIGGTLLAPLPVFGVWMVPAGLAILAPHWPGAARLSVWFNWQCAKFLRWAIRHGFVRVKRRERKEQDGPSSGPA